MRVNPGPLLYLLWAGLFDSSLEYDLEFRTFKENEMVDLNGYFPCTSMWKRRKNEVPPVFTVTNASAGAYLCDEDVVIVIVTDGPQLSSEPGAFMPLEKVDLICTVTFWFDDVDITHELTLKFGGAIIRGRGPVPANRTVPNFMTVRSDYIFPGGNDVFLCTWAVVIKYGLNVHKKELTVEIYTCSYVPAEEPRPSKQIVELGEPVTCRAKGQPTPQYNWTCHGIHNWFGKGDTLIIKVLGNFSCTCIAWNCMSSFKRTVSWRGFLLVLPKKKPDSFINGSNGRGEISATLNLKWSACLLLLWFP